MAVGIGAAIGRPHVAMGMLPNAEVEKRWSGQLISWMRGAGPLPTNSGDTDAFP